MSLGLERLKDWVNVGGAADTLEGAVLRVQVFVSSMSIRYKIAGALVAVLCLAIASLGVVSFREQKRTLSDEMGRRAEALARQTAAASKTALLTQEDVAAYSTLKDVARMPDVVYAFVQDRSGRVFVHSDLSKKGAAADGPVDKAAVEAQDVLVQRFSESGKPVLDIAVPIFSKLGERTIRVGTARVGLSEEPLAAAIRRQGLGFLGITSAFVALGLVISFALGKVLTRQIIVLMTGMKVVSEGNLNHLVAVGANDEIGRLTETFNQMILKLREKLHMERYLSRSTIQVIRRLRDQEQLRLGGERRHVAVLFSDVRGFTDISERLDAAEVVGLLNVYLNLQAEVVYQRGGVVDKFVGDEVMALFTENEPEYHAALAAQEIHNFVQSLNEARSQAGRRVLTVGVGLNAGEVILGNMGSERQMDYTAIGDPINVAARLCGVAKPGQVVASQAVADALGERGRLRRLEAMPLKGKLEKVQAFELLDVPGSARRDMRRVVDLDVECRLAGVPAPYRARLKDLSRGGCQLIMQFPLALGSELEVALPLEGLGAERRASGIVRHVHPRGGSFHAGLRFETLDGETQRAITEWVHQVDTRVAASSAMSLSSPV